MTIVENNDYRLKISLRYGVSYLGLAWRGGGHDGGGALIQRVVSLWHKCERREGSTELLGGERMGVSDDGNQSRFFSVHLCARGWYSGLWGPAKPKPKKKSKAEKAKGRNKGLNLGSHSPYTR